MPNWCSNVVRLSKEGFDFETLGKQISTKGLYAQFLPAPTGLDDHQLTDWCYRNWGVKWDTTQADMDLEEDTMTLYYDSPWSAPRQWLAHMVSIGFDVRGAFWESGMAMGGVYATLHDGALVAPMLEWTQDNLVERGSEMYEHLISYGLILEDDEMFDD